MRKLLLLSSVFVLSFGVTGADEAKAQFGAGVAVNVVNDSAVHPPIVDKLEESDRLIEDLIEDLIQEIRQSSAQNTTGQAAGDSQGARFATGLSQNHALTAQQSAINSAASALSGVPEQYCWFGSNSRSFLALEEFSEQRASELYTNTSSVLHGEAGSISVNGSVDAARQIYDRDQSQCIDRGGDPVSCATNSGGYLTDASVFTKDNLTTEEAENQQQQIEYTLTSFVIPKSANPARYENPTTDTKGQVVQERALKSMAAKATAIMSQNIANRSKTNAPVLAARTLFDSLVAGGAISEAKARQLLPEDGASKHAVYKAMVLAQQNAELQKEKLISNPETVPIILASNAALQSAMMFDILTAIEQGNDIKASQLMTSLYEIKKDLDLMKTRQGQ